MTETALPLPSAPKGFGRRVLLFLFSHRLLAVGRWDLHFLALRMWNALVGQKGRIRKFMASRAEPVRLNLGSGPRGLDNPHWVNVDGFTDRNVHFLLDISRRLPFGDQVFVGVFCEHVMEHFTLEDGEEIARDVRRILQPGGVFRVVVPDGERVMRNYFDGSDRRLGRTRMEVVNSYFRQRYEHQFMYDAETLEAMLRRVGFKSVEVVSVQTGSDLAKLDDPVYAEESLYIEARR
jgi:predicted SAM-dependent methyltransferase